MKTKKLTPFQVCFRILTDENIFTNKSKSDMHELMNLVDYFKEIFDLNDAQYKKWWENLNGRTDLSADERWTIEENEWNLHSFMNIRDSLRKSGVLK